MIGDIMFKFGKIRLVELAECKFAIICGKNVAFVSADDETFVFSYAKGGEQYTYLYNISPYNIDVAIWEWLCTLSQYTNPEHKRVLGSMRLCRVEPA